MIKCGECCCFMEYTEVYKLTVEKADGDCYLRKMHSDDDQFCAVTKEDYCSYGKLIKAI